MPKFLSIQEAGQALGLSRATINRRLKDGSIPSTHVGARVLIPLKFIEKLEEKANAEGGAV